jgi:hypothetical protein
MTVNRFFIVLLFIGLTAVGLGLHGLNARFETYKAPRRLQADLRERITAVAKALPNVPFVVMSEFGSEPAHFALDIADALKAGGWVWQPYVGPNMKMQPLDLRPAIGFTVVDHIEIQSANGYLPPVALYRLLKQSGLGRVELVLLPTIEGPVTIIVGAKP